MTATMQSPPTQVHVPREGGGADRELVGFVGRHGVVAIEHAMSALGLGRSATYHHVAGCIEAGLLERIGFLRGEPSLLRATRAGLRYAGLGLPVAVASPGLIDHWLRCASAAQLLAAEFGAERVLSERELALWERIEGRPIFSAKIGANPDGRPRLHRPDLAILTEGLPIAVEVELTPKSSRRLEGLIRAWRRASWIAEVRYHCEPGPTRRAVERAVAKTYAEEKIRILEAAPR